MGHPGHTEGSATMVALLPTRTFNLVTGALLPKWFIGCTTVEDFSVAQIKRESLRRDCEPKVLSAREIGALLSKLIV